MPPSSEERTKSTAIGEADRSHRRLLALWEGGSADWRLPDEGSLDIGRSQACQLRIDHASVSRRHAVLHAGAPDAIEDTGSSNGTRVNGQRISSAVKVPIHPGDTIEIGKVLLVMQGIAVQARTSSPDGAMARARRLIELAAPTTMTVLLLGETGVGKDVAAEQIHRSSPRAKGPLLRLNCAALSESLLESELFGHEKGAFTGAVVAKAGLLEAVGGGTLLLDEVGELPAAMQAKLLLVLERHEVIRVGSVRPRPIDVRFVAATNRDLEARIASEDFRRDLFYRLNGVTIRIPPLRERPDEIEPLARDFVQRACAANGRRLLSIAPQVMAELSRRSYPGNIRELKSLVERAVAFAEGASLDMATLTLAVAAGAESDAASLDAPGSVQSPEGLRPEVLALERQRMAAALAECGGNQTRAAELLRMPRRTFVSKLSRYGLTGPRKG
jgi:two-component system response regulator AtoC